MAVKVLMPKGSDTMTEGKLLKWVKKEGDQVSTGDTIVEIETDKADMEVEAVGSGVLRKILVDVGKVVPVGELLAVIAKPDEDISALLKPTSSAAPAPAAHPAASAAHTGVTTATSAAGRAPARAVATTATAAARSQSQNLSAGPTPPPAASGAIPATAPGGRVLASPLARRMAQQMGLDLARIAGTGPGGRIGRQDIERTAARAAVAPHVPAQGADDGEVPSAFSLPAPAKPPRPAPATAGPEFYDEPLSSMRKTIATRLVQSLGPVPHFYLTIEVDMKCAKELRESANLLDPELKLSYNDIILKACAAALRQHPEVNASFQGESIRYHNRVDVGMAVAVEGGGLITPVIRDCDHKTLREISHEARDLAARARNRRLAPNEYVGGTFSISNLGMMGIEEFSAVINPPEAAILAVGAVTKKPVEVDDRIGVGLRCRLTLSCDHRIVDGATAAKFLQALKQVLENPMYLAS